MRTRTIITLAVGAIALMLTLPTQPTQAMPAQTGIAHAAQGTGLVQEAAYVCRRYFRHGRWYRHCFWVAPRRYYYHPYRRHWRHHRW